MNYSRELRKLTLFYVPKQKDKNSFLSMYYNTSAKKAPEIRLPGVVVSSLRPVYVYVRKNMLDALEESTAYVVFRSTSNLSLHVGYMDKLIKVNDYGAFRAITGKQAPLPIRLLYMLKDRERKLDVVEPIEVYEEIVSKRRVYVRTCWTRLLDTLFAKNLSERRAIWVLIVWRDLIKIWNIPQLSPLEYLSIDRVRETLKIADEVVTRIVVYEPVSDILLIIQPLQSIKLEELRKMIYRRPRIPVTREEVIEILRAYTSSLEDIDYPVRIEP